MKDKLSVASSTDNSASHTASTFNHYEIIVRTPLSGADLIRRSILYKDFVLKMRDVIVRMYATRPK